MTYRTQTRHAKTVNKLGLFLLIVVSVAFTIMMITMDYSLPRQQPDGMVVSMWIFTISSFLQASIFVKKAVSRKVKHFAILTLCSLALCWFGLIASGVSGARLPAAGFSLAWVAVAIVNGVIHAFYDIKRPDAWADVRPWFIKKA